MEILWVLALVLALFPGGVLRLVGWLRWPRRRQSRLQVWHVRTAGLVLLVVGLAAALSR
jgi:hypothetical protein